MIAVLLIESTNKSVSINIGWRAILNLDASINKTNRFCLLRSVQTNQFCLLRSVHHQWQSKTSFVSNLQPSATFAPVKFSFAFRQTNQFVCISRASCVCSRKPFTYLWNFLLQVLQRPRLSCMIVKAKQTRCYPVRGLVDLLTRSDLRSSSRFRFIGQRTMGVIKSQLSQRFRVTIKKFNQLEWRQLKPQSLLIHVNPSHWQSANLFFQHLIFK